MSRWIPRSALAEALGEAPDTVKKRCLRQGWRTRRVGGSGQGGKEVEVLLTSLPEDLQARLGSASQSAHSIEDRAAPVNIAELAHATPEQRKRALARARLLDLAEAALDRAEPRGRLKALDQFLGRYNRGQVDGELLLTLGPVRSRRSVEAWIAARAESGLAGLLDRRGRPSGSGAIPGDMRRFITDLILVTPRIRSQSIYRLLPAQFPGQALPAERTVRALVAQFKADNKERLLALHQPSLHKRLYQPSLGRADADLTEPNQRWEIDSTRGDIMGRRSHKVVELVAKDGRRYTLIAVVDVYSRRAAALMEEKGGGLNINQALLKSVRKLGVPLEIIMDNGKDYQSHAVQSFCRGLNIHVPEIPGYSPELKPHVERFFDTIQSQLFALLPGYTANKVDNRKEIILAKMSRQEIQREIDLWVEAYEIRVHGETGQAPIERGNPTGWVRRTVPEEQLHLLLNPPVERGVRQGRIQHNKGLYYAPELMYLDGSARVLVREDPDDAGVLHVFDDAGAFLCQATDLARLNLTPAQITEERRLFSASRKLDRKAAEAAAKAIDLPALNRRALEMEIAGAAPVEAAQEEIVDIPGLREAAQAAQEDLQTENFQNCQTGHPEREERPDFASPVERYEWTIRRMGTELIVSEDDRRFIAEFELGRLWRLNGGEQYREQLLGRQARGRVALAC